MVRFLSSVRQCGATAAGKASKGTGEGAGGLKAELTRACLMGKSGTDREDVSGFPA